MYVFGGDIQNTIEKLEIPPFEKRDINSDSESSDENDKNTTFVQTQIKIEKSHIP